MILRFNRFFMFHVPSQNIKPDHTQKFTFENYAFKTYAFKNLANAFKLLIILKNDYPDQKRPYNVYTPKNIQLPLLFRFGF